MLNLILSGVGVALKVAAPIFVPAVMAKLEKELPDSGDGPRRRDAVILAVRALAISLQEDGVISADEAHDLLDHVARTIETFLPAVQAQAKGDYPHVGVGACSTTPEIMPFDQALKQLKVGQRVCRRGWNGKGQWIALQRPDGDSKMTLPYLYIRTVQGDLVPWLASQTDILAGDWELVAEGDLA